VGEARENNLKLVANLEAIAHDKHVSVAQLALAWVLSRGDDVVPIPGTKRRKWLLENIAASDIDLSDSDIAALESAVPRDAVEGLRYHERSMGTLNG
jgi:aryl-alcohol dehydrogenase-like predicted oxidoreductase